MDGVSRDISEPQPGTPSVMARSLPRHPVADCRAPRHPVQALRVPLSPVHGAVVSLSRGGGGVGGSLTERKATCPRCFWLSELMISIWFSTLAWTFRTSTWDREGGGEGP